ncbi:MAG: EamA family transporter [Elusimicrobia bacterium]|nr:EamA family transporter [Elusimicrobiota bacterium]
MTPQGMVPALAAPLLFGLGIAASKALLAQADPVLLAGGLYLCSGLGLAAWSALRRGAEAPLRKPDLPWLAAVAVSGGIIGPVLLMLGLKAMPANAASLLLNLEAALTALLAWAFFRENLGARSAGGIACIVAGAAALSWQAGPSWGSSWGAWAVAGACLAWALDNNFSQKLSAKDPVAVAAVKGLCAGTFNLVLAASLGTRLPQAQDLLFIGLVGLLGYGLSLVCFLRALRLIGAARTGACFSLAPFIGAAAGVLFLGEPFSARLAAAAAAMAAGLYLMGTERHEHAHRHEGLSHEHLHSHDEHHRHEHSGAEHGAEHSHSHSHEGPTHSHPHQPDIHHRH